MTKNNKHLTLPKITVIFLLSTFFLVGVSISCFHSTSSSNTNTRTALWENGLSYNEEMEDLMEFVNGANNTRSFTFEVYSNSEVTSQYDLNIGDIPYELGCQIIGDDVDFYVLYSNGVLGISYDDESVDFDTTRNNRLDANGFHLEKNDNVVSIAKDGKYDALVNLQTTANTYSFTLFNHRLFGILEENAHQYEILFSSTSSDLITANSNISINASFEQVD